MRPLWSFYTAGMHLLHDETEHANITTTFPAVYCIGMHGHGEAGSGCRWGLA